MSRSAETSARYRVHVDSEWLVGPEWLLILSTAFPHQLSHPLPLPRQSGDWWRVEGYRAGRRKGRKRTSEPCSTAAGAYRGKLAGRTVPTDLGACWARHRFPPRVSASLCVHTVYGCSLVFVCAWSSGAGGPLRWCRRRRRRGPFRAHLHALSRGGMEGGFSGVLPLCRCLCFSPTTVLPLRYTRGPWPIVSKAGAGESRSGEKRSGEHTP